MHVVDSQLAEDVLAVSVDGVETGEALLGYFFCGHAKGYVLEYLGLGAGQLHVLLVLT